MTPARKRRLAGTGVAARFERSNFYLDSSARSESSMSFWRNAVRNPLYSAGQTAAHSAHWTRDEWSPGHPAKGEGLSDPAQPGSFARHAARHPEERLKTAVTESAARVPMLS